jgi:hypothetical protein
MPDIEDQDHEPVVVNLVEDPPVSSPDTPRAGIADELCGLPRPGIFRKPVDDASDLLPDSAV